MKIFATCRVDAINAEGFENLGVVFTDQQLKAFGLTVNDQIGVSIFDRYYIAFVSRCEADESRRGIILSQPATTALQAYPGDPVMLHVFTRKSMYHKVLGTTPPLARIPRRPLTPKGRVRRRLVSGSLRDPA